VIKLTFCLHRLPHLTRDAFQKYWFEHHAPLVASYRGVLRIRKYVQLHAITEEINEAIRASRGAPEMYDGVAQLWWDSLDDLRGAQTPERLAAGQALLDDERTFIDLSRSPLFFGEERVIFG
jgi:uncharacterized protein (TIGR02118 family)